MNTVFEPATAAEAGHWLRDRLTAGRPFAIRGAGTRSRPAQGPVISTLNLRAERFFHPADMVVGVEAGTRWQDFQARLAEAGMTVPVNPWFRGATVGGLLAANDFGPDRLERGGLRDYIIGIEYLDGLARKVKAGGRVVKNVTGYDLGKMMLGSLGGLGLITAVNFKTVPLPREPAVFLDRGPLRRWLESLRALHSARLPIDWLQLVRRSGDWMLGIGFSGNPLRRRRLEHELRHLPAVTGACLPEADLSGEAAVFSTQSRFGGFLTPYVAELGPDCVHVHGIFPTAVMLDPSRLDFFDALPAYCILHPIGGDVHLFFSADGEAALLLARIFQHFEGLPGYLVLERAPETLRREFAYVKPLPAAYALMQRLKRKLDPHGLFQAPFYELTP